MGMQKTRRRRAEGPIILSEAALGGFPGKAKIDFTFTLTLILSGLRRKPQTPSRLAYLPIMALHLFSWSPLRTIGSTFSAASVRRWNWTAASSAAATTAHASILKDHKCM